MMFLVERLKLWSPSFNIPENIGLILKLLNLPVVYIFTNYKSEPIT